MENITVPKTSKKRGAKGRKIGRNRKKCERYRALKTREKNKARRAAKRARARERYLANVAARTR